MPAPGPACPRCALPTFDGRICAACARRPPPFDATRVAFVYAWPCDHLLHRFKYGGALECARYFADALARRANGRPDPQLLVAIPLAAARQRSRGFNQAQELARHLSRTTGVPATQGLIRLHDTAAQVGLSREARARNLRDAFIGTEVLAGRTVALVDDVMTTGATMRAAARAARRAGAVAVEAWVIARTLSPNPD